MRRIETYGETYVRSSVFFLSKRRDYTNRIDRSTQMKRDEKAIRLWEYV